MGGVCLGRVSALGGSAPGGCLLPGGVCSRGCLLRGVSALGVSAPGGVSHHALRQTPPVDRQTPVKT